MTINDVVEQAQEYMRGEDLDGWLLYDYRGMNPIVWDTLGPVANVTRPCWVWVPRQGAARLLVSFVDQGRFAHIGLPATLFVSRDDMVARLGELTAASDRVAMEYTPLGALPRASKVDAGTLELVRGFGLEVVPSADLVQYATQRWSPAQLDSHVEAVGKLGQIVQDAFRFIGDSVDAGVTELDVADLIGRRYAEEGLEGGEGTIVAVNEHASDPHFEPTAESASKIVRGDWVLIDLWARKRGDGNMFADITWTAFVGDSVPARHQEVFDVVIGARDAAVAALEKAFAAGQPPAGWEVDRVARQYIDEAGYGEFFNHRLGHSLGYEAHGNAVNLDGWETHDTRRVVPGIAVTIEPGIYLPEFGVRSEIDVYISESGPRITSPVQRSVVLINP